MNKDQFTCKCCGQPIPQEGRELIATCFGCGKTFKYISAGGPPRKYCTLQCQKGAADRRRNPDKYVKSVAQKKRRYA